VSAKEYPVDTLAQMAAIKDEAMPRFIGEFPVLLEQARRMVEYRRLMGIILEGVGEVADGGVIWLDDGERNVTLSLETDEGEQIATFESKP
jgi:hypothetical protein